MCSQFWKGHHSCHGALIYPRVYWYTLASKAPLSVHGVCTLWRYLSNAHALWYNTLYAADIALYKIIRNPRDYTLLQGDITSVCSWIADNLLILNILKCCYMVFSRKHHPTLPSAPLYERAIAHYPNRHANATQLSVSFARTNHFRNSYFSSTIALWNTLNFDTSCISSLASFKHALFKELESPDSWLLFCYVTLLLPVFIHI